MTRFFGIVAGLGLLGLWVWWVLATMEHPPQDHDPDCAP